MCCTVGDCKRAVQHDQQGAPLDKLWLGDPCCNPHARIWTKRGFTCGSHVLSFTLNFYVIVQCLGHKQLLHSNMIDCVILKLHFWIWGLDKISPLQFFFLKETKHKVLLIILNWMFVNTLITRRSETWWYLSGFSDFARLIIGTYTQPSKWNSTSWNSFYGEVTHIVNGNQAFYKFLWHFSVFNLRGSKCTYLRITECPLVFAHLITFDFNLQENWHYNIQHHLVMGPALPCGPVLWRGPISKSCFKTFF